MKTTPIGYQHDWNYKVESYKSNKDKNKENFTEIQSKTRNKKTKTTGNFKTGTPVKWKLKGTFKTTKKNKKYITITKMKKKWIGKNKKRKANKTFKKYLKKRG